MGLCVCVCVSGFGLGLRSVSERVIVITTHVVGMPLMRLPVSRMQGNGRTALAEAAFYGRLEIVHLLLQHGARARHQDKVMRGIGCEGAPVWARSFI